MLGQKEAVDSKLEWLSIGLVMRTIYDLKGVKKHEKRMSKGHR